MSYFLLSNNNTSLLGSATPLIKKAERQAFVDAAALLRRADALAGNADASIEAARRDAVQQGYAEGTANAEAELNQTMQGFGEAIARIEEHHAAQVADAAYAATVAIIGQFEDDELLAKLVSQVLAKQKEQAGLAVHVAPEMQERLAGRLSDLPVVANPQLERADCHVMTADGRIIASLPVQLSVLRGRWGLENAGGGE